MLPELTRIGDRPRSRPWRFDGAEMSRAMPELRRLAAPLFAVMALTFVIAGGGSLDAGPDDARVGLAAGGPLGPLGQVYGYWAPDLWPGRVALCFVASLLEENQAVTPGSVLWPNALAAVAIGAILARRLMRRSGCGPGLVRALLVRLPGSDRSLRGHGTGLHRGPGDRGRNRSSSGARVRLGGRPVGESGRSWRADGRRC